ncbi:MFS transporter [Oceanicoccus sp. KOV_DT_Chl]|uniref:MFS transporter n=1 Tax=Oceanicoccus sp. KOV_DT_Chl TaxID=1904639 RepID=UPI000C7BE6EE|nr:MFS transporter [Oceanicoccus sp. KOV_DT_Chl]
MTLLFFTVLIDLIGFGIIIPILPFMAPQLGASYTDVFMITAIYSLCTAVINPFWGKMSDRFGRKPVLLVCLGGACVSYLMLAFCTTLIAVYLVRAFAGLMAGNFGVASAMVADMTDAENRAKGMGMIGAAFGLGMTIGPGLGGVLSGVEANFVIPSFVAAGLSFVAMLCGMFFLKESLDVESRAENARHSKANPLSILGMLRQTGNMLLVLQYLLLNSCVSLMTVMFPIWTGALLGWTPVEVGYTLVVQGFIMALMQGTLIGPLSKFFGELRFLLMGIGLLVVGTLLASQAMTVSTIVISFFVSLTGATFCTPVMNSITTKRTPPQLRGRMLGLTSSMGAMGRVVGPAVGALMMKFSGFEAAWLFAATVAVLYGAWAFSQLRRYGINVKDIAEQT